ncbi:MAG TPA: hypothetical protein VHW23_11885 [Kofleriaceae bacterium]|jgi:hypothetical protein|nr:hypothetical protein [Kofleriaceae bacterium]
MRCARSREHSSRSDDTAPKLRAPFVAAQAYIAAHGRLQALARRTATGEVDVELVADPLAMAHAAAAIGSAEPADATRAAASAVFGAERRVHLAAAARVAILDDQGNRMLELEPAAAAAVPPMAPAAGMLTPSVTPAVAAPPESPRDRDPPWTRRWLTWAIPTGVFALGSAGFGIAAIASYARARDIASSSGNSFLSDAQDNVHRGRIFFWITAGAGAAAAVCAIPAAIYLARDVHHRRVAAVPTAATGQLGLAIAGRF